MEYMRPIRKTIYPRFRCASVNRVVGIKVHAKNNNSVLLILSWNYDPGIGVAHQEISNFPEGGGRYGRLLYVRQAP